jgi:cytochrome P450
LRVLAQFRNDPLNLFLNLARTYGDCVRFAFGPTPAYLVSHPDYVHQLLVEDAEKVYKTRILKRVLGPSLGQGLLINDGDAWRRQRRLVQPAFHMKRIEAYGAVMVSLAQRVLTEWQAGGIRDVNSDMVKLTLAIVAKTLFDADVSDRADSYLLRNGSLIAIHTSSPIQSGLSRNAGREISRKACPGAPTFHLEPGRASALGIRLH